MTRGGTRYDGSPSRFDQGSIGWPTVDSPHDRGDNMLFMHVIT